MARATEIQHKQYDVSIFQWHVQIYVGNMLQVTKTDSLVCQTYSALVETILIKFIALTYSSLSNSQTIFDRNFDDFHRLLHLILICFMWNWKFRFYITQPTENVDWVKNPFDLQTCPYRIRLPRHLLSWCYRFRFSNIFMTWKQVSTNSVLKRYKVWTKYFWLAHYIIQCFRQDNNRK